MSVVWFLSQIYVRKQEPDICLLFSAFKLWQARFYAELQVICDLVYASKVKIICEIIERELETQTFK